MITLEPLTITTDYGSNLELRVVTIDYLERKAILQWESWTPGRFYRLEISEAGIRRERSDKPVKGISTLTFTSLLGRQTLPVDLPAWAHLVREVEAA